MRHAVTRCNAVRGNTCNADKIHGQGGSARLNGAGWILRGLAGTQHRRMSALLLGTAPSTGNTLSPNAPFGLQVSCVQFPGCPHPSALADPRGGRGQGTSVSCVGGRRHTTPQKQRGGERPQARSQARTVIQGGPSLHTAWPITSVLHWPRRPEWQRNGMWSAETGALWCRMDRM